MYLSSGFYCCCLALSLAVPGLLISVVSAQGDKDDKNAVIGSTVVFDSFYPETDICYDEATGQFDTPCDTTRFPTCDTDNELICYNRRPFRNRFYEDTRQPMYYIDYTSVLCYPKDWAGCSSCSPGRYCKSEARCILQEEQYPCAVWY